MRELDLHKEKEVDKSKQKNDAKNAKPKSVLESFEYIVELAEDSNLDNDFIEKESFDTCKIRISQVKTHCYASGSTRYVR